MKFIHSADIHLDGLSWGLRHFYGQKKFSINEYTQKAFIRLIDLALSERVDFLIIAGDLFDSTWKDYRLGLFFIDQIKRLSCPVYYIRGNHDSDNRLLKKLSFPAHVHMFPTEHAATYKLDELKVALHGQSYNRYHIREDLSANYPKAIEGYYNIGLLHTSGDVKQGMKPYAPFNAQKIAEKGYDYWALGHIHNKKIISEDPFMAYSGCLVGRHIQEEGEKGCFLVEVDDDRHMNAHFKQLSTLLWKRILIDVTHLSDHQELNRVISEEIESLLSQNYLSYVIRIILTGFTSEHQSVFRNKEFLENELYLHLDSYKGRVKLEKIINQTQHSNTEIEHNPLLDELSALLKDPTVLSKIDGHLSVLLNRLKAKAPLEYQRLPFFRDLQEHATTADYLSKIKNYVHEMLQETIQ